VVGRWPVLGSPLLGLAPPLGLAPLVIWSRPKPEIVA
jgi:hypothetical protein